MFDPKFLTFICMLLTSVSTQLNGQSNHFEPDDPKYFVGIALGGSLVLGDFGDMDVNNPDAGFAQNGRRYDLYGGYFLNKKLTLAASFRYQNFKTDVNEVVAFFTDINPGVTFSGENGDWQTYYFLLGAAYGIPIIRRFALYPRFGLGPLWAVSPGLDVEATGGTSQNEFIRSSEKGLGLGFELGVGLRTDLGKRFTLLPTFTFSGGRVNFSDVETRFNRVTSIRDFETRIQSFNLGLSLAYRL